MSCVLEILFPFERHANSRSTLCFSVHDSDMHIKRWFSFKDLGERLELLSVAEGGTARDKNIRGPLDSRNNQIQTIVN